MLKQVLAGIWTALMLMGCTETRPGDHGTPEASASAGASDVRRDTEEKKFSAVIWQTDETRDLAAFERAASRAKAAGATHVVVSGDLPRAKWEYAASEVADDPYPAWYDYRPSLFKIFTPPALRSYIPQDYAEKVADVLAARCAVLRRLGMKAVFQANEPQVLPEAVFRDHPLWRGPRVDQPNRSRAPHFAPCVDEEDVLSMYRESMAAMLKKCPEIELFRFVTTDAGSGFCWAPGLYPGQNGPAHCKERPMAQRVRGFLEALQAGAKEDDRSIEVRIAQIEPEEWMTATFGDPASLARQMPAGTAINNFAAPDATPYAAMAGWGNPAMTFFNPVRGVPNPADVLSSLRAAFAGSAPRVMISAPRGYDELYAELLQEMRDHPPATSAEEAAILQRLAASQAGADAEDLVQVWRAIARANEAGQLLKFAYPSTLGGVHQRWITRPFVPFPGELPPAQRAYYRQYIFQAKGEKQAEDLVDLQAMHLYEGWSGRMWILNVYNRVEPEIRRAREKLAVLARDVPARRAEFELLDGKLQAFLLLSRNARDAVNYQAVMDYLKERKTVVDENPPLGATANWDRAMAMQIARDEIDNTAALIELLKSTKEPLIDTAASADGEDITLLGPDLVKQLKEKIDIMNAHWKDYDRLSTAPNQ